MQYLRNVAGPIPATGTTPFGHGGPAWTAGMFQEHASACVARWEAAPPNPGRPPRDLAGQARDHIAASTS
ncbi:hypothetical protein [Spongiactinospora sp. 9N601]|uniref:hypothetical protein n=1 Tax=Spongiactinospora sp. 9N601 TaxID=3375149 RepID=UPI00378CEAF2